jgi:hypothetical protein
MVQQKDDEGSNASEMIKAKAWQQQAQNESIRAAMGMTQQKSGPEIDTKSLIGIADNIIDNTGDLDPEQRAIVEKQMRLAQLLIASGNVKEGYAIMAQYLSPGQAGGEMDPERAPVPPGVKKIGEDWAIAPNGERVYIGG